MDNSYLAEKQQKKESIIEDLKQDFIHHRRYSLAKDAYTVTDYNNYQSLAITIRDHLIERWILTQQRYHDEKPGLKD